MARPLPFAHGNRVWLGRLEPWVSAGRIPERRIAARSEQMRRSLLARQAAPSGGRTHLRGDPPGYGTRGPAAARHRRGRPATR